jgi:integrase
MTSKRGGWTSAKHRDQWISTLRDYAFPTIGHLRVDEITSADVLEVLQPIWLSKAETARRVRQRLRAVFDWSIAMNLRETMNPVDASRMVLPKLRDRKRHFPALPYAELPAFLVELRAADVNLVVKVAFEFLIATATRTSETLGATWGEIDVESALWTVPGERMKSRIEHRVPLTKHTLELLDQARDLGGNKTWIFPGRSWTRPLYHSAFGVALKRMGWSGITPHGMRSSFRDWTAERTSAPRNVGEAALAHQVGDKTEAAYFRSDLLDRRRLLMNEWSRFLAGGEGKVVNMRA